MKLFMVRDVDRWGHSLNVVEAEDEDGAVRIVRPDGVRCKENVTVELIEPKGVPGILWRVNANVKTVGPQHDRFEDTLPTGENADP